MIARRTGLIQSNISRIFALKYRPTLDTFIKLADALKLKIVIEDKEGLIEINACYDKIKTKLNNNN